MGYQTYHQLTITPDDGTLEDHKERISEDAGYGGLWEEPCKWYDHDDDMLEYSKLYPDVTFILDGDGEESGDIWRTWYKNGKSQEWALEVNQPDKPPLAWSKVK